MDFASEAVWRKPFVHGLGIDEGFIDAFRRRAQDAVQADSVGGWVVRAHCYVVRRYSCL
jgi:hypothetical protein